MKKLNLCVSIAVGSLIAMPAFAGPLGGILDLVLGQHHTSPPCGAPAPLLAAGLPAFILLGGGALMTKLFRQRSLQNQ